MCVCVRTYCTPGHRLDDPGVFGPDEAQTVERGKVTVHLFLETESSPDLPTETHSEFKHDCSRWETNRYTLVTFLFFFY